MTRARLRRPLAVATATTLLLGGAATLGGGPLRLLEAGAAFCRQPTLSGLSASHGPVGTVISLYGTNLDPYNQFGCSVNLTVHIGGSSFTLDSRHGSATNQPFTLPQAAWGPVQITDGDGQSTGNNLVFVTDPIVSTHPAATPKVGQGLSAGGSGLDVGGNVKSASITWAASAGSCPASTPSIAGGGASLSFPGFSSYCNGSGTLSLSWVSDTASGATSTLGVPIGSVDVAPTVTGTSPSEAAAGSTVSVKGNGFGSGGTAKVGGVSASSSWTDTAVTVTLPDSGTGGSVSLTRADGVSIAGGNVTEGARIDSVSPANAQPGATVTLAGGGFGSTQGSITLAGNQVAASSWSPTSVSFQVPAGARGGNLTVIPAAGAGATVPFGVAASISGVSPTHGPGGSLFQLNGSGFGSSQGTVTVAGHPASISLWGEGSIVAAVPDGLPIGFTQIAVTPPGQAVVSTSFTVDPGHSSAASSAGLPPPGSSNASSSSSSATSTYTAPTFIAPSADGPIISTSPVQFQKPPTPAGPVTLTLSPGQDAGDPGTSVPLDVALVAFGKPVTGAKVDFQIVVEPGRDASISPAEAVTDDTGHARSTLHLSTTSGDHIVLATSGQYSDEVRVVGRGADTGAVAAVNGAGQGRDVVATVASGPPKVLVVGALVLCLLLFLTGFAIHMLVPRGRAAPLAAVPVALQPQRPPFSPLNIGDGFATLLQFACMAAFVVAVLPPVRLYQRLTARR